MNQSRRHNSAPAPTFCVNRPNIHKHKPSSRKTSLTTINNESSQPETRSPTDGAQGPIERRHPSDKKRKTSFVVNNPNTWKTQQLILETEDAKIENDVISRQTETGQSNNKISTHDCTKSQAQDLEGMPEWKRKLFERKMSRQPQSVDNS
ncbi:uncharacterized protein LOC143450158 [Clavelina lepadiformis]|uniref:uncharacterized protein LOC143450158 n=1 Tax=Clavelina lepadiformis TaxID=159417 RepID=UPI0040410204